jgi:HK97 family phage major capsid protein
MATKEINFKINDALVNGGGDGIPLGVHNANSKITVTAVSGQGANTFIYQNVLSMFARVTAGQRGSLIWLYNQDVEPQLLQLYMPTGTAAGVALFTPNSQGPGFKLQGAPALVIEQCQSLGTAGDVIAFATDGYACITKGGLESFMSMHLRFDYDEQVFKWRFRLDGQPYDDVALTPYKGTNTTSSIVELSSTRT